MSSPFYRALVCVLVAVSLSGVVWMVLHYFFARQTEFGTARNSAESTWLQVHGIVAVAAVFLLGGVAMIHVVPGWKETRNRPSGLTLAGLGIILILSGYALYYITADSLRTATAIAHETVGLAAIGAALLHWKRVRR
jgi:uncharacterized membrane protein YjgN (DUF898 family)